MLNSLIYWQVFIFRMVDHVIAVIVSKFLYKVVNLKFPKINIPTRIIWYLFVLFSLYPVYNIYRKNNFCHLVLLKFLSSQDSKYFLTFRSPLLNKCNMIETTLYHILFVMQRYFSFQSWWLTQSILGLDAMTSDL